jgi:hypothetical protein
MVFQGTVPPPIRSTISEIVDGWGVTDLWGACAGHFSIQRALPGYVHHGNDVSLYTSALGWWAVGESESRLALKREASSELGWLRRSLKTAEGAAATVMLATNFFGSVGRDNSFHQRLVAGYRDQWSRLHADTVRKMRAGGFQLASYDCVDVREWLAETVPKDGAVVSFPPFWASGYEKLFAPLEKHLDWPKPTYDVLTDDGKNDLIAAMIDRPNWILVLHRDWEGLEGHKVGYVKLTPRAMPIVLYASNTKVRRTAIPVSKTERVTAKRLGPATVLTGKERIALAKLTPGQFSTLRSQHLDPRIAPAAPQTALAVMLDGQIAGCLAFNPPDGRFDAHTVYMLSDFPMAPTRYARLAALIARCAQSQEVQLLLERSLSRRITTIATTAFTDNKVSMKYRSAGLKLTKRSEGRDEHAYQLQYEAEAGRFTLTDAYTAWYRQHANKIKETTE